MIGTCKTPISAFSVLHLWNRINSRVSTFKLLQSTFKYYSIRHCLSLFPTFQMSHVYNTVFILDMCSSLYSLVAAFVFLITFCEGLPDERQVCAGDLVGDKF